MIIALSDRDLVQRKWPLVGCTRQVCLCDVVSDWIGTRIEEPGRQQDRPIRDAGTKPIFIDPTCFWVESATAERNEANLHWFFLFPGENSELDAGTNPILDPGENRLACCPMMDKRLSVKALIRLP